MRSYFRCIPFSLYVPWEGGDRSLPSPPVGQFFSNVEFGFVDVVRHDAGRRHDEPSYLACAPTASGREDGGTGAGAVRA